MGYHLTPVRMAKGINNSRQQQMLLRLWRKGITFALLVGMQTGAATVGNTMEVPQKIKVEPPYDPVIALLDMYPKDTEVPIQKGTCTPMFIAALSTIAKVRKEPKCPSMDERIKKMWHIYNGILVGNQKE